MERENEWRGSGNDRKEVFKGWRSDHRLRLELPIDRDLLNRAFAAIVSDQVESSIEISFEVSDRALLRARVLEDATKNARRNAEAIAAAAGCKLGKILKIEYGWSEIRVDRRSWDIRSTALMAEAGAPDYEPQDIEAEDSVTMVFELV